MTCVVFSLHRNILWHDIKLLPKLYEIICLMRLWFWLKFVKDLFSISEVGQLNSRNLCRDSSWLSHFQWIFLLEKLPAWSLLNRMELGNKPSRQLKQKQLCSEYYCLVNASARILLLKKPKNNNRVKVGINLFEIASEFAWGGKYLPLLLLLNFYQDYFWGHWPFSIDGECV